jgi:hypothetical protein
MPANSAEWAQLKAYLRALQQLVESVEAREKAEAASEPDAVGAWPRLTRIP